MAATYDSQISFSLRRLAHDRIRGLAKRYGVTESEVARMMLDAGAESTATELQKRAERTVAERREVKALTAG